MSLKKTRARLALQHTIATLFVEASEPKDIAPHVLRMICENLGWLVGVLWTPDATKNVLRCSYFWKAPGSSVSRFESISRRYRFKSGIGLPGRIWESARPAWISNVTRDANFPRFAAAAKDGLYGAFGFPIRIGGEVVAVLEFFNNKIESPDRSIIQLMETAGNQLGQFLERRRAQDNMRHERAVLLAQQELSPEGILVVDKFGRIASYNRLFVSMWGIPDAVIERKSDDEALASVLSKLVDPQGFLARVRHLYQHRREFSSDEIKLKDGRIFERHSAPIFSGKRTYGGRVWYFKDVTEQKRAAERLSANEDKYRKLFANAAQATVILDAKSLDIIEANRAAQLLYGYTSMEFMRLTYLDLSAQRKNARAAIRQALRKKNKTNRLCYHKKKNGVKFPVENTIGTFQASGRRMIIAMITDLSDRWKAQEATDLRHKVEVARKFIANVSHELRTPVAAILGFSETLLRGALKHPRHRVEFVKTIHRHTAHLHRLIEDLLDLASLESGKMQAHPQQISLTRFLADFLRSECPAIRRKGLRIRIDLQKSVFISIDETQLRRVLTNLLNNAVKYSHPGGLITVSLRLSSGRAIIAVSDSGIGISVKDLPLIFNRFHRADTALSHKIKGTGLGLSLVKEILTAQGGSIWAESSEGRGSTFYVALASPTTQSNPPVTA